MELVGKDVVLLTTELDVVLMLIPVPVALAKVDVKFEVPKGAEEVTAGSVTMEGLPVPVSPI